MDITLNFVGDIAFTDLYDGLLFSRGPEFPLIRIKNKLSDGDFLVGNLESPLTRAVSSYPHKTPLKANPEYIEGLKRAGFDVLNLSNNHILDYREDGVGETIELLDKAGIKHFGYGNNREEAIGMACCEKGGVKIGFMGYTDIPIDSPFWADEETRGVARIDPDRLCAEIGKNRDKVDFMVVSLHWGIEYFRLPTPDQRALARKIIDCGADLIVGHHPHVIQGMERWNNGLIAYSLGNFVFSDISWKWQTESGEARNTIFRMNKANRESLILKGRFGGKRVEHEVVGVEIGKSGQLREAPHVERRVRALSSMLQRPGYDAYFARNLIRFERNRKIMSLARRIARMHRIRPKHFRELFHLLGKMCRGLSH